MMMLLFLLQLVVVDVIDFFPYGRERWSIISIHYRCPWGTILVVIVVDDVHAISVVAVVVPTAAAAAAVNNKNDPAACTDNDVNDDVDYDHATITGSDGIVIVVVVVVVSTAVSTS